MERSRSSVDPGWTPAHVSGELDAHILDLATYEVGNVLVRALRWEPADAADQLDDLHAILGPPLAMTADWLRQAAVLAHAHQLSFCDASWAATAAELNMPLVSADRHLLAAGPAESATDIVARLKLPDEQQPRCEATDPGR